MRIRKRQVPFPISSLPPVPRSDPHLIDRSPVVMQLNDDATAATPKSSCTPLAPLNGVDLPQPSDQPLPPIGKLSDGSDYSSDEGSGAHKRQHNKQECLDEDDGRGQEGGGQKGNYDTNTWKGGILGSEILPADKVFSTSSPSNQDGRWFEGDKVIPLKKRRGSFENLTTTENNATTNDNKKKRKTRVKMKAKMNKKCSEQQDDNIDELQDDEDGETKPDVIVKVVRKKRGRSSGAVMEGSRCSRVNGRGWRCCQPTLVGYSLCEHHLGKGRLRSMTSVRSRSIIAAAASPKNINPLLSGASSSASSSPQVQTKCVADDSLRNDNGEDHKDDDKKKKSMVIAKKRMKLGMVKARSISSLLGQTKAEIIAIAEDDK